MTDTIPETPKSPSGRRWLWIAGAVLAGLLAFNLSVWLPVANQLGDDTRNEGIGIHVRRTAWVHPTSLTIDLTEPGSASTADLFQSAEVLKDRSFSRVVLARGGQAVFVLSGDDFQDIGQAYAWGQNPLYLTRTLPEKLETPDGRPAFGSWTGGWLGVMSGQMEDVNELGSRWVRGRSS
jgi:hypothetical protein